MIAFPAVASGEVVLRTAVTPEQAWVGQRVVLSIDVLGDTGWAQITRMDDIDLPGAYVMRTDSQASRLQETIEGIAYTGQRYKLSIYPQVAGAVEVPAIPLEVTTKTWGSDEADGVTQMTTSPVTFTSRIPPGAEDVRGLITTSRLTASQEWAPSDEAPAVGDALKRIVTLQAEDVSGMAFTPLQHKDIPGVAIYPGEPSVNDSTNRGRLSGKRTEVATFVFEKAGEVRIPDIELVWWNVTESKLERAQLPGRLLEVAAGAAGSPEATGSAVKQLRKPNLWLSITVLLASAFVLFRFRKGVARRWKAWRKRRHESEARYFKSLIKSIRSGDANAALRNLMRWVDRINERDQPAQLEVFLHRYADPGLQEAVGRLLHNVERGQAVSGPLTLVNGLSTARVRWRDAVQPKQRPPFELPELNRT
ncbi:MAG: hypothetical protein ABFS23_02890 [Pseudomonadota bacterium]